MAERAYDPVFEASVALVRGQVLLGVEADAGSGEGTWGVIDCRHALDAFNARSDAWCGRDGIPRRWSTYAEADKWARCMTGSQYEGEGYQALEIPSKPRLVMAGRHCAATETGLLFECVDWTNGPGDVVAVGSAFDAAQAFVSLMGARLTYAAIYATDAAEARKAAG